MSQSQSDIDNESERINRSRYIKEIQTIDPKKKHNIYCIRMVNGNMNFFVQCIRVFMYLLRHFSKWKKKYIKLKWGYILLVSHFSLIPITHHCNGK